MYIGQRLWSNAGYTKSDMVYVPMEGGYRSSVPLNDGVNESKNEETGLVVGTSDSVTWWNVNCSCHGRNLTRTD